MRRAGSDARLSSSMASSSSRAWAGEPEGSGRDRSQGSRLVAELFVIPSLGADLLRVSGTTEGLRLPFVGDERPFVDRGAGAGCTRPRRARAAGTPRRAAALPRPRLRGL